MGCLPLFGGAQLWTANGEPRRAHVDGVALAAARQRKEQYPQFVGRRGPARLVVLAPEVCGPWSQETQMWWSKLGPSDAVPSSLARSQGQWHRPFQNCLALGAQMGLCPASHEVVRDFRHAGLDP